MQSSSNHITVRTSSRGGLFNKIYEHTNLVRNFNRDENTTQNPNLSTVGSLQLNWDHRSYAEEISDRSSYVIKETKTNSTTKCFLTKSKQRKKKLKTRLIVGFWLKLIACLFNASGENFYTCTCIKMD
jgi:hypothetical protein